MTTTATPTLAAVLEMAMGGKLDDLRVSLPGRVVSYDKAKQRADVQPLISDRFEDENDERKTVVLPVVNDCPVAFQGAGGYSETFPIEKGDTVLLVFCSSSIARWKVGGGMVDPGDDRHHALPDAIAYAGVRDFAHALTGVPSDAWVITTPSGKQIRLGSALAFESAIKGLTYRAAEDTFLGLVVAAFAALAAAVPTFTGTPAQISAWTAALSALTAGATTFFGASATYLAQKVKVE